MAPTESSILSSYLLAPASLPTIISFEQFRSLFPSTQRSNPQTKQLYRDLQFFRTVDIDVIRENIAAECKRGERQKAILRRALHTDSQDRAMEGVEHTQVDIDIQLFGPTGNLPRRAKGHTMSSLVEEMELACDELEAEAADAEAEAQEVLSHVQETIGGLSDLRYGKFAKAPGMEKDGVEKEIIKRLGDLEDACNVAQKAV